MPVISLDELTEAPSKARLPAGGLSLDALEPVPIAPAKTRSFGDLIGDTSVLQQEATTREGDATFSAVKALGEMARGLKDQTLEGLAGMNSWLTSLDFMSGYEDMKNYIESKQEVLPPVLAGTTASQRRSMDPKELEERTSAQQTGSKMLEKVSEGMTAVTDYVFDRTEGLPPELRGFLAATTLTGLSIAPVDLPVRALGKLGKGGEAIRVPEAVSKAFEETAVKNPEAAVNFTDDLSAVAPEAAKDLKTRLRFDQEKQEWTSVKSPEMVGKEIAQQDIAEILDQLDLAAKAEEAKNAPVSLAPTEDGYAILINGENKSGVVYKDFEIAKTEKDAVLAQMKKQGLAEESPVYKPGSNTSFPELLPDEPPKPAPLKGEFFLTLNKAVEEGKIDKPEADLTKWFLDQGANVSKNVSRAVKLEFIDRPKGVTANAFYYPSQRLIQLLGDEKAKPTGNSVVHEVLHHMEKMMPANLHRDIRAMWARDLAEMAKNGTELQRKVAWAIHEYHRTGDEAALKSAKMDASLYAQDLASKTVKSERFRELYQLWDPSEYWAVNGARIMESQYKLTGGAKDAIKRWGNQALDKIKSLLGMDKDSALLSAIRSVFNGKGEFITDRMLSSHLDEIIRDTPAMTARAAADLVAKGAAEFDSVLSLDRTKPFASEAPIDTTKNVVEEAFRVVGKAMDKTPGIRLVKSKLETYIDQAIRTVNPGIKGEKAKIAESVLAESFARAAHEDSAYYHQAFQRGLFWEKNKRLQIEFRDKFETGDNFASNPELAAKAKAYKEWKEKMATEDKSFGILYDERDNYLPHIFKEGPKIADHFQAKYGRAWGKPGFVKDRGFDLYKEAIAAGYTPRFTNPEDIMLARQHASTIAQMKVGIMRELEKSGLAFDKSVVEEPPGPSFSNSQSAPNGKSYWVHDEANLLLDNAFNTTSLWSMEGIVGDLFRSAMNLKNAVVPIELSFSLFHPLHVATIDNATAMVRASKLMLSGKMNPLRWTGEMIQAALYKELVVETGGQLATLVGAESRGGHRVLQLWQGKIPLEKITPLDRLNIQSVIEGGLIPEMSSQYRTKAIDNLRKAWAARSVSAGWHLPWAALEAIQKPMFEIWIPSLKTASYLRDVSSALKSDPSLMSDNIRRRETFTKLRKSVDNRYGEMAYNTLFWNKWVKDLAVASSLSLGWNLGFIREYGGAVTDMAQTLKSFADYKAKTKAPEKPGLRFDKEREVWLPTGDSYIERYLQDRKTPLTVTERTMKQIRSGGLDRPLFVAFYSGQALVYGGLITYFLAGKEPESAEDYIIPQTGKTGQDGKPERLNTMFYTREFLAMKKHMEMDGVLGGLSTTIANKASPSIGVGKMWFTGEDSLNREIRNPNDPLWNQIQQTGEATLEEIMPISFEAIKGGDDPLLAISGFSKAPAYMTQSKIEGEIKHMFIRYNAKKLTPFDQANMSEERKELRKLYSDDPKGEYEAKLEALQDKYDLSAKDIWRIEKDFDKGVSPSVRMFQNLTWQQQKLLLDKMTKEERETYLPVSNRAHLRLNYEEPK